MKFNDEQLLAETYKMIHLQEYVDSLEAQGKSLEEVKEILIKEGLWDSVKAGFKTLNPFGKSAEADVAKDRYKKMAGSGLAKLAHKGITKGAEALQKYGVDADAVKKNPIVKAIGKEGQTFGKTKNDMKRTYSGHMMKAYKGKIDKFVQEINADLGRGGLSETQIQNMYPELLKAFQKALGL
jgi:hypothetical protein